MTPKDELLFLALGGSGEIGMNVNLYGCQGKWVMVDLGLTFADPLYPGVELVLPETGVCGVGAAYDGEPSGCCTPVGA